MDGSKFGGSGGTGGRLVGSERLLAFDNVAPLQVIRLSNLELAIEFRSFDPGVVSRKLCWLLGGDGGAYISDI